MKTRNMIKTTLGGLLAGGLLASQFPAALAHHSFYAEFDSEKPVVLEGTVKEMRWQNPHSWLVINVENEDGEIEEWMVEGGSPNVLMRNGWTRDSLPPGTEVRIEGFGSKDDSHRASSSSIEFPDGTSLRTGGSSR